jgi:hypothetical protein
MWQDLADQMNGTDFNWYAVDSEGCIGLFATAGEGWIPKSVAENLDEHRAISENLDEPHFGSLEIWTDYAKLGFFVFDWGASGFSYRKMTDPIGKPDSALVSRVMAVKGLPRLPYSFATKEEVGGWS